MKVSVFKSYSALIALSFSGLLFCNTVSAASEFKGYKTNYWDWRLTATYFQTNANYVRDGNQYQELSNGNSLTVIDVDFGTRWTPTTLLGLYLYPRVTSSESRNTGKVRTNSGLSQVVAGVDWLLYNESFQIIPDVSVTFPSSGVDTRGDSVLLSEGALELKTLLRLQFYYNSFRTYTFAGFQYREAGRASLVPVGAGMEFNFTNWNIGGKLTGFTTLGSDKYSSNPAEREIVAPRNGDSLRFYSVNPALLEADGWLRWQSQKRLGFELGGGATLTGRATAAGWNVKTTLIYEFDVQKKKKKSGQPQFKEDTEDGVDQSLFD